MDPIAQLAEYFREFPGIGPRQAKRFVYYLLTRNTSTLEELSRLILEVKKSVHICKTCYRFFSTKFEEASTQTCSICANKGRDSSLLMIVSKDVDLEAVEKSHAFNGYYFVLGGLVPILEKSPESKVRLRELNKRIELDQSIREIILSLSATPDGEHTADTVKSYIKANLAARNLTITILGRGLSTGSELEYVDADTIKNALVNRA